MDLRTHLILYVDDESANRVVFDKTFGKKYRVKCVASGEEAIAVVRSETVAVLVTDQRMPGMSGDQLLAQVKELAPDTLRIVVTAYSDLEPILRAVNEGLVVRYIIKPWDRAELDETLRWALEAYVVGRQNGALHLRLVQAERLLTLGQVSATVLHDLNQPVAILKMTAPILKEHARVAPILARVAADGAAPLTDAERETVDLLASELKQMADDVASCTEFMASVLDQLRGFQAMDPPRRAGTYAEPNRVVKLALSMCREGNLNADSTTVYEGPTDLPRVRASAAELLQILINLVRNAQDALLEAGKRGGRIVVHASEQPSIVRFVVEDDGPGIPPDILGRLGTFFFTTRKDGTGLGIANCKRLVAQLGGDFHIESSAAGTAVLFTVPKSECDPG